MKNVKSKKVFNTGLANMVYVIVGEDVGPNRNWEQECYTITIQNKPGRTNLSRQEKIDGWLETTNDYSETAHGEFKSVEEAENYIKENFDVVEVDSEDCIKKFISKDCDPESVQFIDADDWFNDSFEEYMEEAKVNIKSENLEVKMVKYFKQFGGEIIDGITMKITGIQKFVDKNLEELKDSV